MHNPFDQLGKRLGLEALGACGLTVVQDEIWPGASHADLRHVPDPARAAERERLGLLGRMASILCLIEIYSGAPDEDQALACLAKLIAFRQKRRREANKKRKKRGKPPGKPFVPPFVWILSATRPTAVLKGLGAIPARGWPRGVHVSPGVLPVSGGAPPDELDGMSGLLRMGVVVASELPRDRSTILVRLMAAGPALNGALEDMRALPADAHEPAVAADILLGLHRALGTKPDRTTEEQEVIMHLESIGKKLLANARDEGRNEGRDEGRNEGQLIQARVAVRRVLAARSLAPSPAEDARIDACADLATLEHWLAKALTARSAAAALRSRAHRAAEARPASPR